MTLLSRRRLLLAKAESTFGTDSSPTATDDAFLVRNMSVSPIIGDAVNRDLVRSYLGNSETLINDTFSRVEFEVELAGVGSSNVGDAPKFGRLLNASGFEETLVANTSAKYTPVSDDFGSVTLYAWHDGQRYILVGGRGQCELQLPLGNIPFLRFTMEGGVFTNPTDTAQPATITYDQEDPVLFHRDNVYNMSVFGFSTGAQVADISMDCGISLQHRDLIGSTAGVDIVDRRPTMRLSIAAPTLSDKNFFTALRDNDTGTVSFDIGNTAGHTIALSFNANLSGVSIVERNGIDLLDLEMTVVPTDGNDEMTLTFT